MPLAAAAESTVLAMAGGCPPGIAPPNRLPDALA